MASGDLIALITKRQNQIRQAEHVVRMQGRLGCLTDAQLVASNADRFYPHPTTSIDHLEKNPQLQADDAFQVLAEAYHRLDRFQYLHLASCARNRLNYWATQLGNRQVTDGWYEDIVCGKLNDQLKATEVAELFEGRTQQLVHKL